MEQVEKAIEAAESADVQTLTDEELAMVGGARIGGGGTGSVVLE